MSPVRVADLLDDHGVFDEVLAAIRRDAHARRLASAGLRLAWLRAALGRHMALEEDVLMPVFEGLEHPVANGAPDVFRRDHALILRLLAESAGALSDDRPVDLADALAQLAGVLEHHDLREARYFKGRLDGVLGDRAEALVGDHALAPVPAGSTVVTAAAEGAADGLDAVRWRVAVGRLEEASDVLASVEPPGPKGARLVARVAEALEAGDPLAAQDALRLLVAASGARPARW